MDRISARINTQRAQVPGGHKPFDLAQDRLKNYGNDSIDLLVCLV